MGGVYYFYDNHGNRQKIYNVKVNEWKSTLNSRIKFKTCKECYEYLQRNGYTNEKAFETDQYKKNKIEIIRISNKCSVGKSITDFEISISGNKTLLIFKSGTDMFSFDYVRSGVTRKREVSYHGDYDKLINFVETIEEVKKMIKTHAVLFDGIVLIYKSAVKSA